jgi:hypothetical protein
MHSKSKYAQFIKSEAKRLDFCLVVFLKPDFLKKRPIRELVKEESEWANVFHGESF